MDSNEQMSIKCQSLSDRLRMAIGLDEDNPAQFLERTDEIDAVIDATCCALESEAKEHSMNLNVSDSVIVNCLFYRVYHEKQNAVLEKEYKRATIVCILQFLRWCKDELQHGRLERRWLYDFDFDVKVANVLGNKYSIGKSWRAKTNNTLFQYADICALLTGKFMPQPVTRDMLALFGVRQALETKFRRIIGLEGVDPMVKIPHGAIPKILIAHEKSIEYKSGNVLPLDSVMHVYDWTDFSIHTMSSNYVWLVWKAVYAVRHLFYAGKEDVCSYFHINGSVEISHITLERMREDFRRWISANTCRDKQVTLYWGEPEIPIVNDAGQLIKIKETREIIFNLTRVRQIKRPCVFLLIKEWPNDDMADVLRKNITELNNFGARFCIFVNSSKNAGVGALGIFSIPWKKIPICCDIDNELRHMETLCEEQDVTTIIDLGIYSGTAEIIKKAAGDACAYEVEYLQDCPSLITHRRPGSSEMKRLYAHLNEIANTGAHLERDIAV